MSYQPSLTERLSVSFFAWLNKYISWYKMPGILGALNLGALRTSLRGMNLFDGYASGTAQGNPVENAMEDPRYLMARHSDGRFNSLEMPLMGCAGMRLGRNFPRSHCQKPTDKELWTPNPRLVSERFMKRGKEGFKPATTLNLLAAAWIQFQTHDWFNHEEVSKIIPLYSHHECELVGEVRQAALLTPFLLPIARHQGRPLQDPPTER